MTEKRGAVCWSFGKRLACGSFLVVSLQVSSFYAPNCSMADEGVVRIISTSRGTSWLSPGIAVVEEPLDVYSPSGTLSEFDENCATFDRWYYLRRTHRAIKEHYDLLLGRVPPVGQYHMAYSLNPDYFDPRDGRVFATHQYGVPIAVPLAPNVLHTFNYSRGIPSSRVTPISRHVDSMFAR